MADSDDEYDRKRRDKFRGERSSGDNYRSDRRNDDRSRGGRDDWQDRNRGGRPDYRDYRRDRFSPDRGGPPVKRMRNDWGEDGRPRYGYMPYGGGGGGVWGAPEHYPMHGAHGFGGPPPVGGGHGARGAPEAQPNQDLQTQPPMLTLKQFLVTQDDSISDSDAINKYNEYKQEFKRQQLNEFFVTHKDEEWFKMKYHPEESSNRREEQVNFLKNRAKIFEELLDTQQISKVSVDTTQTDQLLRLLDTAVIKLEGGTDEDLKVLDVKPIEIKPIENKVEPIKPTISLAGATTGNESSTTAPAAVEEWGDIPGKIPIRKVTTDNDEDNWDEEPEEPQEPPVKPVKTNPFSRKPEKVNDGEWNDISSKNETAPSKTGDNEKSWNETTPSSPKDDKNVGDNIEKQMSPKILQSDDEDKHIGKTIKSPGQRKRSVSESSNSSSSSSDSDNEDEQNEKNEKDSVDEAEKIVVPDKTGEDENMDTVESNADADVVKDELDDDGEIKIKTENDEEEDKKEEDKVETIDLDKEGDPKDDEPGPKALHKTSSIFLRNLAPTITKSEVEAMCKRYSGFLRVAIADPLVERRWFRRGWVTFQRDVNIKEICWNLNNIRLRDCELGAIVNRDLSRRVRPINGITAHKNIVRSDIKLCAKIAYNLDVKASLWQSDNVTATNGNKSSFGLNSNNPVLQNITDYLIEEASAEEDELLGLATNDNKDADGELLERDPELITVLDKLILYLRIVHSVDFYNHCEYPYEDEMPNRLGIIHARGPAPQNKVTSNELQEYIRNFENKMSSFLAKSQPIDEDELKKLGCKDTEAEVEKFIQANTQELAKDKWLCPLSGKKFKGPDFIRKHIFNKHNEKVDEVKKEVEYFNNYLKDPKRPQLPEHPGNNKKPPAEIPQQPGYRPPYMAPMYAAPYAAYAPPMVAPPRPRGGFSGRRGGGGGDYRPIIHYRDLDAPREPDDFL